MRGFWRGHLLLTGLAWLNQAAGSIQDKIPCKGFYHEFPCCTPPKLHGFANFGNVLFNLIGSMMMDFLKNLFFLFMIMSFSRTLSVILKNQLNDMKQTDPKLIQGMKLLYFHNPYVLISLEAI